jgi:hypothetical protein
MVKSDLTQKTLSGILWKFAERIGAQVVTTIVSIILARILLPEDYGIIAIVNVLIAICNVLVSSGFGSAKRCTEDGTQGSCDSRCQAHVYRNRLDTGKTL